MTMTTYGAEIVDFGDLGPNDEFYHSGLKAFVKPSDLVPAPSAPAVYMDATKVIVTQKVYQAIMARKEASW